MHALLYDRFGFSCYGLADVLYFIYFTWDVNIIIKIYEHIRVVIIINYANSSRRVYA